ncbi:hypothetical protein HELRODRAFT_167033 [Helobdella robusta]|uniref:Uncharacterized protein n=1 Tax=Helobdella robusta TaxID=6412 RepID=T1EYX5_HELRO|nr:hypothetical protein HELRODRAFT_167033 [Helobdella robusta]ESO10534.1 hypothetical protein HELRODRAFT_167033 [Helobdella robusta]
MNWVRYTSRREEELRRKEREWFAKKELDLEGKQSCMKRRSPITPRTIRHLSKSNMDLNRVIGTNFFKRRTSKPLTIYKVNLDEKARNSMESIVDMSKMMKNKENIISQRLSSSYVKQKPPTFDASSVLSKANQLDPRSKITSQLNGQLLRSSYLKRQLVENVKLQKKRCRQGGLASFYEELSSSCHKATCPNLNNVPSNFDESTAISNIFYPSKNYEHRQLSTRNFHQPADNTNFSNSNLKVFKQIERVNYTYYTKECFVMRSNMMASSPSSCTKPTTLQNYQSSVSDFNQAGDYDCINCDSEAKKYTLSMNKSTMNKTSEGSTVEDSNNNNYDNESCEKDIDKKYSVSYDYNENGYGSHVENQSIILYKKNCDNINKKNNNCIVISDVNINNNNNDNNDNNNNNNNNNNIDNDDDDDDEREIQTRSDHAAASTSVYDCEEAMSLRYNETASASDNVHSVIDILSDESSNNFEDDDHERDDDDVLISSQTSSTSSFCEIEAVTAARSRDNFPSVENNFNTKTISNEMSRHCNWPLERFNDDFTLNFDSKLFTDQETIASVFKIANDDTNPATIPNDNIIPSATSAVNNNNNNIVDVFRVSSPVYPNIVIFKRPVENQTKISCQSYANMAGQAMKLLNDTKLFGHQADESCSKVDECCQTIFSYSDSTSQTTCDALMDGLATKHQLPLLNISSSVDKSCQWETPVIKDSSFLYELHARRKFEKVDEVLKRIGQLNEGNENTHSDALPTLFISAMNPVNNCSAMFCKQSLFGGSAVICSSSVTSNCSLVTSNCPTLTYSHAITTEARGGGGRGEGVVSHTAAAPYNQISVQINNQNIYQLVFNGSGNLTSNNNNNKDCNNGDGSARCLVNGRDACDENVGDVFQFSRGLQAEKISSSISPLHHSNNFYSINNDNIDIHLCNDVTVHQCDDDKSLVDPKADFNYLHPFGKFNVQLNDIFTFSAKNSVTEDISNNYDKINDRNNNYKNFNDSSNYNKSLIINMIGDGCHCAGEGADEFHSLNSQSSCNSHFQCLNDEEEVPASCLVDSQESSLYETPIFEKFN